MSTNRKAVLMIDDNVELTDVARTLFDPKEFLFVSAKEGTEGLFKAKNQKFDVVICDLKMPKMDGSTFVKEFRRLMKSETPILLYSGHLDALPLELRDLKGLYRLAKPCQSYELLERVRSLAGGASAAPVVATPASGQTKSHTRFEAGSYLFREGDRGADGYVLMEGTVELLKEFSDGTELILDTVEIGEFIGSWAPADGLYRFCSARAKTEVLLNPITQAQINKELENQPAWMQAMVKGQYHRLNNAYQRLRKHLKAS